MYEEPTGKGIKAEGPFRSLRSIIDTTDTIIHRGMPAQAIFTFQSLDAK
jgi:hypothetical protein